MLVCQAVGQQKTAPKEMRFLFFLLSIETDKTLKFFEAVAAKEHNPR